MGINQANQPKIPIQEHHHTAAVAMGLLASKEDW